MTAPALTSRERVDRARVRSWALQVLYRWESQSGGASLEGALSDTLQHRRVSERRTEALERRVHLVADHLEAIDSELRRALTNWNFDRLSRVDRSILRVGVAELLFDAEVPGKVAIQEAVRLAERYGGAQSPAFVNGVLDAVYKAHPNAP